jgi:hypothetical protein
MIVRDHNHPTMQYGGSANPPFEHIAYVSGLWNGLTGTATCPDNGLTNFESSSWVYYLSLMCGAQAAALGPYGGSVHFSPPFSDASNFKKLVTAGRGIGNVAAHETGHQISFSKSLSSMDCEGTTDVPCGEPGDYWDPAGLFEYWQNPDWNYIDYSPPIHWLPINVCRITMYLLDKKNCK